MKFITLTQGEVSIVDDADYDMLSEYNWCLDKYGDRRYAKSAGRKVNGENCDRTRMHRLIMEAPEGLCVDHINGNGLDNRRCNLRVCTQSDNCKNRRKVQRYTSIYKGVFKKKQNLSKPWVATIRVNGSSVHLGYFKTEREAAVAYNKAAEFHYKEFASINIIQKSS